MDIFLWVFQLPFHLPRLLREKKNREETVSYIGN